MKRDRQDTTPYRRVDKRVRFALWRAFVPSPRTNNLGIKLLDTLQPNNTLRTPCNLINSSRAKCIVTLPNSRPFSLRPSPSNSAIRRQRVL